MLLSKPPGKKKKKKKKNRQIFLFGLVDEGKLSVGRWPKRRVDDEAWESGIIDGDGMMPVSTSELGATASPIEHGAWLRDGLDETQSSSYSDNTYLVLQEHGIPD